MSKIIDIPDVMAFYEYLRAVNPHLPAPQFVTAATPMQIEVGVERMPVVNMSVMIRLPDMYIAGQGYTCYPPDEASVEEQDRPDDRGVEMPETDEVQAEEGP